MKKITVMALSAAAALSLSAPTAHADGEGNGHQFTHGGIQAADNPNHATCLCPVPLTTTDVLVPLPQARPHQAR